MDESTLKLVEAVSRAVAVPALLIGAAWAAWRYRDEIRRSSKRSFLDRQLEIYVETTTAAGLLANCEPDALDPGAESQFLSLYYGPLAVVESQSVADAAGAFARALRLNHSKSQKRKLAFALARECRASLEQSWDAGLTAINQGSESKSLEDGSAA